MEGFLCLLYAEMRSGIPYAFEGRMDYLTILYELFLEIYNCFERAEKDVTEKFRQQEHIQPEGSRESAQDEQKGGRAAGKGDTAISSTGMPAITATYFLRTGSWNRLIRTVHLQWISLNMQIWKMTGICTVSVNISRKMNWGLQGICAPFPKRPSGRWQMFIPKDTASASSTPGKTCLKKSVVNIRYTLGFEKVIRIAIDNFRKMGSKAGDLPGGFRAGDKEGTP